MSNPDGKSVFYHGEVPLAETERLRDFKYPDIVSASLLPADFNNGKLLDVGSGNNPSLEQLVAARRGHYTALDFNQNFLKDRSSGSSRVRARAESLPFADRAMEMVHSRFMLMHLPPENRRHAIQEIKRVGEKSVILEWDWGSWAPKIARLKKEFAASPEALSTLNLVERFLVNSQALGAAAGIEMNMGSRLKDEVTTALGEQIKVTETRIERPAGDYYSELIELGKMTVGMWNKIMNLPKRAEALQASDQERLNQMSQIVNELENLTPEQRSLPLEVVDIVAVSF